MKMKVALIGYGKMGHLLETRLQDQGHRIVAVVDPLYTGKSSSSGAPAYASLDEALSEKDPKNSLKNADAAIEYTGPDSAVNNLLFLIREKIPVVTGTTGWYDRLPEIVQAVNAAGTSLVWSSNFSLGVNLFYRIAAYAAKLVDPFKEYDVAG